MQKLYKQNLMAKLRLSLIIMLKTQLLNNVKDMNVVDCKLELQMQAAKHRCTSSNFSLLWHMHLGALKNHESCLRHLPIFGYPTMPCWKLSPHRKALVMIAKQLKFAEKLVKTDSSGVLRQLRCCLWWQSRISWFPSSGWHLSSVHLLRRVPFRLEWGPSACTAHPRFQTWGELRRKRNYGQHSAQTKKCGDEKGWRIVHHPTPAVKLIPYHGFSLIKICPLFSRLSADVGQLVRQTVSLVLSLRNLSWMHGRPKSSAFWRTPWTTQRPVHRKVQRAYAIELRSWLSQHLYWPWIQSPAQSDHCYKSRCLPPWFLLLSHWSKARHHRCVPA